MLRAPCYCPETQSDGPRRSRNGRPNTGMSRKIPLPPMSDRRAVALGALLIGVFIVLPLILAVHRVGAFTPDEIPSSTGRSAEFHRCIRLADQLEATNRAGREVWGSVATVNEPPSFKPLCRSIEDTGLYSAWLGFPFDSLEVAITGRAKVVAEAKEALNRLTGDPKP